MIRIAIVISNHRHGFYAFWGIFDVTFFVVCFAEEAKSDNRDERRKIGR